MSHRTQVQDCILTFRTIGLRSWESTEPLFFSCPLFSYHRLTFTTPLALELPTALRFRCCLRILHPFLRGERLPGQLAKGVPVSPGHGSHLVKHGGGGGSGCGAVALPKERRVSELDSTQNVSQWTLAIRKPQHGYLPSHRRERIGVNLVQRWPVWEKVWKGGLKVPEKSKERENLVIGRLGMAWWRRHWDGPWQWVDCQDMHNRRKWGQKGVVQWAERTLHTESLGQERHVLRKWGIVPPPPRCITHN